MRERPISFSGPLVLGILADLKWKTRRLVTPQPVPVSFGWEWRGPKGSVARWGEYIKNPRMLAAMCPYGQPGDRLWVREEHACLGHSSVGPQITVRYQADGEVRHPEVSSREYALFLQRKSPLGSGVRARFMYRSLSRLLLEVTDVHVERLQDITEEDAIAEGLAPVDVEHDGDHFGVVSAREQFTGLWDSIHGSSGPDSWDANPWVRVVEFRRVS